MKIIVRRNRTTEDMETTNPELEPTVIIGKNLRRRSCGECG